MFAKVLNALLDTFIINLEVSSIKMGAKRN